MDTEIDTRMGRMPCEHGDRNEGHVSTRQGKPKLAKLPEALKRQRRIPFSSFQREHGSDNAFTSHFTGRDFCRVKPLLPAFLMSALKD